MEGLPKLPGLDFENGFKFNHSLPHCFDFRNGYRVPKRPTVGIGGDPLRENSIEFVSSSNDCMLYDPILTYGRVKHAPVKPFRPHYVVYDKVVLTFHAFFKQGIPESPQEHYRIRYVNMMYFMEDDSITVMEPTILNCGFPQGRIVRRGKIPKNTLNEYYTWKDFNVGIDMELNGIVFHITDCDEFTKEFLTAQGVELNETESTPVDPYATKKLLTSVRTHSKTPSDDDKLRRYLEFQGKILTFDCLLDETDRPFGEYMTYKMYYFLEDDTIAVRELKENQEGRDHFPLLLKRTKLPKNWKQKPISFPTCYMEISDEEITEYYQPVDLRIGSTIFVFGRRFLLYDCDQFTRYYYTDVLKAPQKDKIPITAPDEKVPKRPIPEYLGLGTPEDSLTSCFGLVPKPPKKDMISYLVNANKYLRYGCLLDNAHPEDKIRRFIMKYSLADGTITISEPPIRNSGIQGGRFLAARLIVKPGSNPNQPEYYTAKDLYIDNILIVNYHRFKIISADLYVYRYMKAHPEMYSQEAIENVRQCCLETVNSDDEEIMNELTADNLKENDEQNIDDHLTTNNINNEVDKINKNIKNKQSKKVKFEDENREDELNSCQCVPKSPSEKYHDKM